MNIRKTAALFVVFLSFACASAQAAPSRAGKTDMGLFFAGAFPPDHDVSSAFYAGGNLAYGINDWLGIGFSGGYQDSDTTFTNTGGARLQKNGWSTISLFGDILFRGYHEDWAAIPYGVLGLGTLISHPHGTSSLNGANLEVKSVDSFAVKLGGGIDFYTSETWIFNIETAYVIATSDARATNKTTGAVIDSRNLDYWFVGAGVKWQFS